ncbi:hypothetical protein ACFLXV_01985 [Chloroflexota bacterium]
MVTTLKRTTIFLTAEQHEGLRRIAFEQRTSMAELLRNATLQLMEDEGDIQAGLRALSDEEGTMTWDQYVESRKDRSIDA